MEEKSMEVHSNFTGPKSKNVWLHSHVQLLLQVFTFNHPRPAFAES